MTQADPTPDEPTQVADELEKRYERKANPLPATDQAKKKLTDIQKIVLVWKITEGYDKDDKPWDKINFSRCSKSAKLLLEFLGNWETAADCIEEVHGSLTGKGFSCSLETVVKHASTWKIEKQGRQNGKLPPPRDGSLSVIR